MLRNMEQRDYVSSLEESWRQRAPGLDTAQYASAIRLIRAGRMIESSLNRVSVSHGLAVRGDYEVLAALRREPSVGLTPGHLAERGMLTTAGMTGRLDRLEAEGLIERRPHPTDRRSVHVLITTSGEALVDLIFEDSVAVVRDELLASAPIDWSIFSQELRELSAALEQADSL